VTDDTPLTDLLVEERDLYDDDRLEAAVTDHLRIDGETGRLVPRESFADLDAERQATGVLLARRVAVDRDLADTEWMGSAELADAAGEPIGRVFPALRELEQAGVVAFDADERRYRVPPEELDRSAAFLAGESLERAGRPGVDPSR